MQAFITWLMSQLTGLAGGGGGYGGGGGGGIGDPDEEIRPR